MATLLTRGLRRGILKAYWVLTIASANLVATAAEVNAGTPLNPELQNLTGFSFTNALMEAPDWNDNFDGKVQGIDKSADSTMTFYDKAGSAALRTTLAKGTTGFVVLFSNGIAGSTPAASDIADVWPSIVTGPAKDYDRDALATWHTSFGHPTRPKLDVAIT